MRQPGCLPPYFFSRAVPVSCGAERPGAIKGHACRPHARRDRAGRGRSLHPLKRSGGTWTEAQSHRKWTAEKEVRKTADKPGQSNPVSTWRAPSALQAAGLPIARMCSCPPRTGVARNEQARQPTEGRGRWKPKGRDAQRLDAQHDSAAGLPATPRKFEGRRCRQVDESPSRTVYTRRNPESP